MAPAHPEHYALPPGGVGIVESIGEHIACVRMDAAAPLPEFVLAYGKPESKKLGGTAFLDDDTLFFYAMQEVRETGDGCQIVMRILFPAAAPRLLFDEHTQHLAVEFRSFVRGAFERQQRLAGEA